MLRAHVGKCPVLQAALPPDYGRISNSVDDNKLQQNLDKKNLRYFFCVCHTLTQRFGLGYTNWIVLHI